MGEAKPMLRYKFEDSFSMAKRRGCEECIKNATCYKVNRKKEHQFCSEAVYIFRNPEVTYENAEWLLFQIKRDIMLSNIIIKNSFKPHDDNDNKSFTRDEAVVFNSVMDIYSKFIFDWKKDKKLERDDLLRDIHLIRRKLDEEDLKQKKKSKLEAEIMILTHKINDVSAIIAYFVRMIIDTRINVDDHTIRVYTEHPDLLLLIKEKVLQKEFKFKRVMKIEGTSSWWEPITSVS